MSLLLWLQAHQDILLHRATIACFILFWIPLLVSSIRSWGERKISYLHSIAGGLALASIFIHMIPERIHQGLKVFATGHFFLIQSSALFLFWIFLWILIGFCVGYGMEKIACTYTKNKRDQSLYLFIFHLSVLISVLIASISTFPGLVRMDVFALLIALSVLCFGLFLEENTMQRHFSNFFNGFTRAILMISVVIGWALAMFVIGENPGLPTFAMQSAMIGYLIASVIKTEFDSLEEKAHFPTFLLSVGAKILVTFIILMLEAKHHAT
jgi:hypothetical protein